MSTISDLIEEKISIEDVCSQALENDALLAELMKCVQSVQDKERYPCFKVLFKVGEDHPARLYTYWSQFENMLNHENSYFGMIAIQMLAGMAKVDSKNRFEKIIEKYFQPLFEEKAFAAMYAAGNAWKIALAKPHLQDVITDTLLRIETDNPGKQKELLKAHAIESFSRFYGEADLPTRKKIMDFVKVQSASSSPKTRKAAKEFLKEFG